MSCDALRRALSEPTDPALRPLPEAARVLLERLGSPPRLAAHLRAVHDVASQLADWVQLHYPTVAFDRTATQFGAATHDIGKIVHVGELSSPGSAHEQTGYELLLAQGVDKDLARFARTHGSWTLAEIGVEDLLVSLADKVWKVNRVPDLERLVTDRLADAGGQQQWEAFMALDDELDRIADEADRRLAFQMRHPVVA